MSRPLRLDHGGALWHITSRGNERREIFRDDEDRSAFLRILARVVALDRWRVHAYVLMTNHYHLLIETPVPTLSRGMHRLNGVYTQAFNRRHDRVGHLLQGRFHAVLVERERHLLSLTRYIVLNPVRAGIVPRAEDWVWSSYRATSGIVPRPEWLETAWILGQFGSGAHAAKRYRRYVAEAQAESEATPVHSPLQDVRGQVFLGGDDFLRQAQQLLARAGSGDAGVPVEQRHPWRPSLDVIARNVGIGHGSAARVGRFRDTDGRAMLFAFLSRADAREPARTIGPRLGVAPSTASRLASKAEALLLYDPSFRARVHRVRSKIFGEKRDLTPSEKRET